MWFDSNSILKKSSYIFPEISINRILFISKSYFFFIFVICIQAWKEEQEKLAEEERLREEKKAEKKNREVGKKKGKERVEKEETKNLKKKSVSKERNKDEPMKIPEDAEVLNISQPEIAYPVKGILKYLFGSFPSGKVLKLLHLAIWGFF